MDEIGKQYGVGISSVSRVIKRGLARVAHTVLARLTIASCIDDRGRFDYVKFCRDTAVLTERQVEVLYLALTGGITRTAVAEYLGRNRSVISRSMRRAEDRLAAVRVDWIPRRNVTGVKYGDWCRLTERELAERLGLSVRFFYQFLHPGELAEGLPLLTYHALCLLAAGVPVPEAAARLGCGPAYIRAARRLLDPVRMDGVPLDLARLPPYHPVKVERRGRGGSVLAALRDLTRGEDAIIDRVTPELLEAIEKRGAVHAGA